MMSNEAFFEIKIKTFFTRFDSDFNEKLEKEDFKTWALRLAQLGKLDEAKTEKLVQSLYTVWDAYFQPADSNNDGSVEYAEILKHMKSVLYDQKDSTKAKTIKESLPLIFEAIDTDGDGEIMSNEFANYYASLGVTNVQFSNEVFQAMDMNSDGSLNKQEFVDFGFDFFVGTDSTAMSRLFFGPLV